jgi:hypothetical protein
MQFAKQMWLWVRSLVTRMWQQAGTVMVKVASLVKKTKSRQAEDLIPPLAILMGAAAFGYWWRSFAAALFALAALSLLAGIHNNTELMLAALGRSAGAPHFGDGNADPLAEHTKAPSARDEAIGRLKPWLANEVSLTEDNAKECCAVLLDSIVTTAQSATKPVSG